MATEKNISEAKKNNVPEKIKKAFMILLVILFSATLIASPILLIVDFERWGIPVLLIWTLSLLFYLTMRRLRQ